MEGRFNRNIWSYLFSFRYTSDSKYWKGKEVFTVKWWNEDNVFHDSIGRFWNRFIGCRLIGHEFISDIVGSDRIIQSYCTKCDKDILHKKFIPY
jgi:hypothetical protein